MRRWSGPAPETTGPSASSPARTAELRLHCYRILGSVQDAEDMLQETLLAAWRGLGQYEGRASLRTWLYRIATNRCLNALRASGRRPRPEPPEPPFEPPSRPGGASRSGSSRTRTPCSTALPDTVAGPDARYEAKETIALAFVAAVQHLPPRQRAVLLLRDALGFRSAEVADMLDTSEASVNSALQRARATMTAGCPPDRERAPLPRSARERDLAQRFAAAYADDDVDGVVALLTDDAWFTHAARHPGVPGSRGDRRLPARHCGLPRRPGTRLIPTRANGQPAFGCYVPDAHAPIFHAHGLIVLTLAGDRISAITRFVDNSIMARFGMPRMLA